jgi:hypothetical protein
MAKTAKELAFLQDLYVSTDWTERFTNIFDESFKFSNEKNLLYFNAGTGDHVLALREKLDEKIEIDAVCENKALLQIAQAKADLIKAKVNFTTTAPNKNYDLVIVDASFVPPNQIKELVKKMTDYSNHEAGIFLPTAGSFGEIFSFLWETFFNLDLTKKSSEIERLILDLPTVFRVEEMLEEADLNKVKSFTKNEVFEFANASEFINSPLIADFLLPAWLDFLPKKEQKKTIEQLVQTIEENEGALQFRFSVKATLSGGVKSNK